MKTDTIVKLIFVCIVTCGSLDNSDEVTHRATLFIASGKFNTTTIRDSAVFNHEMKINRWVVKLLYLANHVSHQNIYVCNGGCPNTSTLLSNKLKLRV